MNPKITLTENNLNKELIASNIIQHDFINYMVNKKSKNPVKHLLNQSSPFGDYPKQIQKENQNTSKSAKKSKPKSTLSDFRIYYDRGDIPIRVLHSGSLNKIKWNIEPSKIDLK